MAKVNLHTDIFTQKCLNFRFSPVLSSNPVRHHKVWMRKTQISLWPCKSESPLEMTADKYVLPECHNRTMGRVCSAQPEHFFFSPYCSTMPILSSPLEIRNYPLQKFSLSYRNQSIHKAGNGLCLITGNDGSQNSSSVGRHWVILRNKVLACALDRLERMVKVAAE